MKRIATSILTLIIGLLGIILIVSIFWHSFAFKYIFQALTSFSLMMAGIVYIFKKRIGLGLGLFVLSILLYYASEALFIEGLSFSYSNSGNYNHSLLNNLWIYFLNTPIYTYGQIIRIWHLLIAALLFANAMVFARGEGNKTQKFIAANLMSIVFVIVIYFSLR